jgi:superfamily I DNA/RNA helicase
MPWFIPFNFLDNDQRDFVDDITNKKLFINGFAGTGKSVVLVHKLIKIFDENPDAKCCVISFTHSLLEMFKLGIEESGRLSNRISNQMNSCCATNGQIDLVTKYQFRKNIQNANPIRYDFIMIDEVQDLCKSDLVNVLNSGTQEIYLGGDDNQSIYSEDPQDKEPTLTAQLRNELIQTFDRSLVTLYRITPSILTVAKRIMPELQEKLNGTQFGHNRDADVILASAEDERDEVQYVFENALIYAEDIELTAILLPKHSWIKDFCTHVLHINNVEITPEIAKYMSSRNYTELNRVFSNNDIRLEYVGNDHGLFSNAKEKHNIVLMTYHSAKGMDFDNVFIPFLSSSRHERFSFFLPKPLMVSITRSNLNLTLSYSGDSMAFVDSIRDVCVDIDIDSDNDSDFLDY